MPSRGHRSPAWPPDPLAAMRAQMSATPIQVTKLTNLLTMLSGPGGNVVVWHGEEGKVVVDTFVQGSYPALKQRLDALSTAPVVYTVNTHWHFDHADNNESFRICRFEDRCPRQHETAPVREPRSARHALQSRPCGRHADRHVCAEPPDCVRADGLGRVHRPRLRAAGAHRHGCGGVFLDRRRAAHGRHILQR